MSGHSKWSTIKRQKEAKDAKKGQIFTKLANAITAAARAGGGTDPQTNFKLRLVMDKARSFNMPKENIARAIDRAGGGAGVALEEAVFEGFLPGGAAVMVSALTDNKLRTGQQIREILDKGGGTLAGQGAVAYLFSQKGELQVRFRDGDGKSREEQELEIIDLGVEEIQEAGDGWVVYGDKDKTFELKQKLEEKGYEVESAELVMVPLTEFAGADAEGAQRAMAIAEKLEELDDVQRVWTNYPA